MAGLALALSEVGIAVGLARTFAARSGTLGALALQRPTRALVTLIGFAVAPFVGVALRIAATRVLSWVPSTGEAPIEAYVSWPSGLLSFAALSAIAPVGEEIFFRGFVYGALRGEGGARRETTAFFGAWLLFVGAHLPQTWGSWGGLAAVALAGLGFTTLRAATGSVLVAALAHLVYNGLLAAAALASS
jgi:membrane protease YdiL (CAAX protease family)